MGLRHRSKRMAEIYRTQRIPVVLEVLDDHPVCQRCDLRDSVDVHEVKTRARGGSIVDKANLVALCRYCHDFLTTHPAQAAAEGLMKNSWED